MINFKSVFSDQQTRTIGVQQTGSYSQENKQAQNDETIKSQQFGFELMEPSSIFTPEGNKLYKNFNIQKLMNLNTVNLKFPEKLPPFKSAQSCQRVNRKNQVNKSNFKEQRKASLSNKSIKDGIMSPLANAIASGGFAQSGISSPELRIKGEISKVIDMSQEGPQTGNTKNSALDASKKSDSYPNLQKSLNTQQAIIPPHFWKSSIQASPQKEIPKKTRMMTQKLDPIIDVTPKEQQNKRTQSSSLKKPEKQLKKTIDQKYQTSTQFGKKFLNLIQDQIRQKAKMQYLEQKYKNFVSPTIKKQTRLSDLINQKGNVHSSFEKNLFLESWKLSQKQPKMKNFREQKYSQNLQTDLTEEKKWHNYLNRNASQPSLVYQSIQTPQKLSICQSQKQQDYFRIGVNQAIQQKKWAKVRSQRIWIADQIKRVAQKPYNPIVGLQKSTNFKSCSNQVQFRLMKELGSLIKSKQQSDQISPHTPDPENVKQVLSGLKILADEHTIFNEYLSIIYQEMERAIYCTRVHLPELIKNYKYKGQDVDEVLMGMSKIPWFEVCNRLNLFIQHFISLAEKQKSEHINQKKELKQRMKSYKEHIRTLQSDIESLKRLNSSPLHQQYMEIAQAKAKLTSENDILKYSLKQIQKQKVEADNQINRLKHQKATYFAQWEQVRKQQTKLREDLTKQKTQIINLQQTIDRIQEEKHQFILVLSNLKGKMESQEEKMSQLTTENTRLAVRAATAYQDLTPRFKNWQSQFKSLSLESPIPSGYKENQRGKKSNKAHNGSKTAKGVEISQPNKRAPSNQYIQLILTFTKKLMRDFIDLRHKFNRLQSQHGLQIVLNAKKKGAKGAAKMLQKSMQSLNNNVASAAQLTTSASHSGGILKMQTTTPGHRLSARAPSMSNSRKASIDKMNHSPQNRNSFNNFPSSYSNYKNQNLQEIDSNIEDTFEEEAKLLTEEVMNQNSDRQTNQENLQITGKIDHSSPNYKVDLQYQKKRRIAIQTSETME